MFRDGQYFEVIKDISDNCLATAIVTVKEKVVEINKKKVTTNKWLNLVDWAELYKILEKAITRSTKASLKHDVDDGKFKSIERRKLTSRLDIVYTFEPTEDTTDMTLLPTIKVRVSPARRHRSRVTTSEKKKLEIVENTDDKNDNLSIISNYNSPESKVQRLMEGIESSSSCHDEYVPVKLSNPTKVCDVDLEYVPSRTSILKKLRRTRQNSANEYTPMSTNKVDCLSLNNNNNKIKYIPNPVTSTKGVYHEAYEPPGISNLPQDPGEMYVPSSKGSSSSIMAIEEYEPDFVTKTMKFDNSYKPSLKKSSIKAIGINNNSSMMKNIQKDRVTKNERRSSLTKKVLAGKTKREPRETWSI